MFKKIIAVLLAVLMITGLVGCGGEKPKDENKGNDFRNNGNDDAVYRAGGSNQVNAAENQPCTQNQYSDDTQKLTNTEFSFHCHFSPLETSYLHLVNKPSVTALLLSVTM